MHLKRVWSKTSEKWIRCNWFECSRDGFENFKFIEHDHSKLIACSHHMATHINHIFCSEDHMDLYVNSPKNLWNHSKGAKRIVW